MGCTSQAWTTPSWFVALWFYKKIIFYLSLFQKIDLHLILNFVNTCTAFRTSETWTPLCLPRFDDSGFLHAYVCFIATDICLVLISTNPEEFYKMSECRNSIVKHFEAGENNVFQTLENALNNQYYSVCKYLAILEKKSTLLIILL